MHPDATFFAVAIFAVLISAVSKGGFGSGAGFVSAPLLALVMPPAQAVGLLLPLLMLMDVTSLRTYWGKWDWHHARLLMLGGIAGTVVGWLLFRVISADGIRLLVGTMALGFVLFQVSRQRGWLKPPTRDPGQAAGIFWGIITGFTSFVGHAGGPPATMYLLGAGLDKTRYQASTVVVFWWINLIKVPFYVALGMFTLESAKVNLILAPFAVGGVFIGVWAHRIVPEKLFFQVTYALLAVTGAKLMFDALT